MSKEIYQSPLSGRYASRQMLRLFSDDHRYTCWRRLWVALAQAEMQLGLSVTQEQVDELKAHVDTINYDDVARKEHEIRHDVMAHVYAYGLQCPKAKGIIHLGATSCYVTDNADIMIIADALRLIRDKLVKLMEVLSRFAEAHKAQATLGYTHLQPGQLVTVGKRACLWLQDFKGDLEDLEYVLDGLMLLGSKGTTGTQASFLSLFEGDEGKIVALDRLIAEQMGFKKVYPVSGQTYPRKLDSRVLNVLNNIAQSASKFGNDLRLLQHMREMEEPFEEHQVGSSAMAYKRNPMRSERICSLSRYVMASVMNPAMTASTQWLERTLDDSANRRIVIPEAFLATDAVLMLMINVCDRLVVNPMMIQKRVMEFLPFIASENLLMAAVKMGGDRQALHEVIRVHAMEAAARMKREGLDCDLLTRLAEDPAFPMDREQLMSSLNPMDYIGCSVHQVDRFLQEEITPVLARYGELDVEAEVRV